LAGVLGGGLASDRSGGGETIGCVHTGAGKVMAMNNEEPALVDRKEPGDKPLVELDIRIPDGVELAIAINGVALLLGPDPANE
jgi:hypothetical protein